jgi:hypothetical protein
MKLITYYIVLSTIGDVVAARLASESRALMACRSSGLVLLVL